MTRALLAGSYAEIKLGNRPASLYSAFGSVDLPDTLITSGAVISAIDDLKQHATHLNQDIIANGPAITADPNGVRFKTDWQSFVARFDDWNARQRGVGGGLRYLVGQMVADLRRYAAEYNALEDRFTAITGQSPTYNPQAPSGHFLPPEAWVAIGLGTFVATLGFIAWGLNSYARVAAPMARARAAV